MSAIPETATPPRLRAAPRAPIYIAALDNGRFPNDLPTNAIMVFFFVPEGTMIFLIAGVTNSEGAVERRADVRTFSIVEVIRLAESVFGKDSPQVQFWSRIALNRPHLWSVSDPANASLLWTALVENNPDVANLAPSLTVADMLAEHHMTGHDVAWVTRALAVALVHGRPVNGVLLFASILASAATTENDTAQFIVNTLAAQMRVSREKDHATFVLELLRLGERGIRSLHPTSTRAQAEILNAAKPEEVEFLMRILDAAEAVKQRINPKHTSVQRRHVIAALLAERGEGAIAEHLWGCNFDVDDLRRKLIEFFPRIRSDEKIEVWREVLALTAFDVANRALSDVWTYDDALGYVTYAKAISDTILRGQSPAPLTIGIEAPWGQGKTTLMRMIQARLDPASRMRAETSGALAGIESAVRSTYADLVEWLGPGDWVARFLAETKRWLRREPAPEPPADGMLPQVGNAIPTVWFNPLYYRETDQIWAGMAHAILQQLAQQLPTQKRREEFWLRLQLARLNVPAIRRDIQKIIITRLIPVGVFTIALAVGLFFAVPALQTASVTFGFGSVVAFLFAVWQKFYRFLSDRTIDRDYQTYVTEPDYESKLGLLHLVDHDLDRALALLVGPKRSIAVFIDDLDRCDPDTVNQIVLAINQFLSLQSRKVYFFLGIDMDMVARALERAQKETSQPAQATKSSAYRRSFGWRFMEKFIQLPFVIPHLDSATATKYAIEQLRAPADEKPKRTEGEPMGDFIETIHSASTVEKVGSMARSLLKLDLGPAERAIVQETLVTRTSELMEDPQSVEMQRIIQLAVNDLELNPRAIKRYFGLVRILRNVQIASGASHEPDVDRKIVIRAAHLLMNWPQFVHWLREHQKLLDADGTWKDSCVVLDVAATKSYADWETSMKERMSENPPPYLLDVSLHSYLNKIATDPPGLAKLYEVRMF